MNTVILYKNPHPYPYYGSISTYKTVNATPRNQDIKSGYVDMSLTMDDVFSFNYMSFKRNGKTVFAWVENVEELGGNTRWRIHYNTDAFRTYRNDLVLGSQYVSRGTTPTLLEDELLSSTQEYNDYDITQYSMSDPNTRYAVVQVRKVGDAPSSNTPGQPSPYRFFFCPYNVNKWTDSTPIRVLLDLFKSSGETSNIVTIYSIPYADTSKLVGATKLDVLVGGSGGTMHQIDGWYVLSENANAIDIFSTTTDFTIPEGITKSRHSVKILFPEAGIMTIPDNLLYRDNIKVRQDIDIFSGACNYMLVSGALQFPTTLSVRGGALSTIPILSDPYDTYVSQNQNTLAVGLLGDTANMTIGMATGNPVSTMAGGMSLVNTMSALDDARNAVPSNPPAYLGSALVSRYNQRFYVIITKKPFDNESEVRARYGYPIHKIQVLTIPSAGFVQTQNCSVSSNGNVPLWAIAEVNQLFNGGILFK